VAWYKEDVKLNIKEFLAEGNQRFINGRLESHPKLSQPQGIDNLPICAVVGCSDSRTCAEHIFSQSLGNFYSVRNAGHFVTDEVIASLEFAIASGIKNIMIYGHSQCGAIQGALQHIQTPSIPLTSSLKTLLERFIPTIREVMKNPSLHGATLLQECVEQNIHKTKRDILEKSSYLRDLIQKQEITLVSGVYMIETGTVKFFD
jgi:carbonic anhydrase